MDTIAMEFESQLLMTHLVKCFAKIKQYDNCLSALHMTA